MSQKPKCKLCGARHWNYEPHVFSAESHTKKKIAVAATVDYVESVAPRVTPTEDAPPVDVTHVTGRRPTTTTVTEPEQPDVTYVSIEPLPGEPCPTCGRKMPSRNAQRQAAYRGRKL